MVSTHIDSARRRWWGERPTAVVPDQPSHDDGTDPALERDEIRGMLRELTPSERAVVVLRFYCDLSEKDTAATLGIPPGTVKSTCARALSRLRVTAAAGDAG